jgi:hypothetical protein
VTAPEDRFGDLDDTLEDASPPALPADHEARGWLAEQRFVHGLLRALHTADAPAREARVAAVMGRLQGRRGSPWVAAAAALAVALAAALWWTLRVEPLPRAHALVSRAAERMAEPVNRAFELTLRVQRPAGGEVVRRFDVVLAPGRRFVAAGERFTVGSDGETVWIKPAAGPALSRPAGEAHLLEKLAGEVLDLGYLDVETLLARLPGAARLRSVRREVSAGGAPCVRVEAQGSIALGRGELAGISLLVEEATGVVADLIAEGRGAPRRGSGPAPVRLRWTYVGERQVEAAFYRAPQ